MRLEFVINVDGVAIKVQASSYFNRYAGLPHMEQVGSFTFSEVDSGASRGSAGRYNQDCDEIILLAETGGELYITGCALEWIDKHYSNERQYWNWNTSQQGRAEDYQRSEEDSDRNSEEQQSSMLDQSIEQSKIQQNDQFSNADDDIINGSKQSFDRGFIKNQKAQTQNNKID